VFYRTAYARRIVTLLAPASSDITVHAVPTPPQHAVDIVGALPTDSERQESPISATAFVGIVEGAEQLVALRRRPSQMHDTDAVALNKAVGVCYGFTDLRLPIKGRFLSSGQKRYIDLWPTLSGATGWATYTVRFVLSMRGAAEFPADGAAPRHHAG
jgi:hypothetical protein